MVDREHASPVSVADAQAVPSTSAQLTIQSSLMKGYRRATPAQAGKQVSVAQGADGNLQVFTIGSQGEVNNIFRDSKSDTGWSSVNLNLPVKATALATSNEPDGTIVVVASGIDNHVYCIRDARWNSAWHDWGLWGQPSFLSYPIVHLKLGRYVPQGPLYCLVFAAEGHHWYCTLVDEASGSRIQSYVGNTQYEHPGDIILATVNQGGKPQQGYLLSSLYTGNSSGLRFIGQHQFDPETGYTADPYIKVASFLKADGTQAFFALRSDNGHLMQVTIADGKQASFQDIGGDNQYVRLTVSSDPNNLIEIFAVTRQNRLVYIHEDPLATTGWATPSPIADQIIQVTAAKNADGSSEAFAIDGKDRLLHIFQDVDSSTWHIEPIELGTQPILEELNTYTTQMSFRNTQGQPLAFEQVQIASPTLLSLQVNGISHLVDAVTPATTFTDVNGQVNVIVSTDTLSTPELWISADALSGASVVYQANASIARFFKEQTQQTLLDAVVEDGKGNRRPLIVGDETTRKAIASSMEPFLRETLSHFSPALLSSSSLSLSAVSVGAVVLSDTRLAFQDLSKLEEVGNVTGLDFADQHWQLTLAGSSTSFIKLAESEATRLFLEAQQGPQGAEGGSWHLLETIGELYELVTGFRSKVDVLTDLAKFVVSVSPKGLQVLIDLTFEGARYRLNALLTKGQELMDMLATAFAWLGNRLEDLLNYLKGVIYWDDIMRTCKALEGVFTIACDWIASLLTAIKQQVHLEVGSWEKKINEAFNSDTIQKVVGANSPGTAYQAQASPKLQAPLFTTVRYQLIQQLLTTHLPNLTIRTAAREAEPILETSPSDILPDLLSIATSLQDSMVFSALQSRFAPYLTAEGNLSQAPLSLILDVLKDIALFSLEASESLLGKLIDNAVEIIKELPRQGLVQVLDIPVLSDLYLSNGGKDLAVFDLAALALAFPITLYYRDTYGESLFPDDTSVQNFERWLATQLQGIHIGQVLTVESNAYVEPAEQWKSIVGIGGALLQVFQGLIDAQLDIQSVVVTKNGETVTYGAGGKVGRSTAFQKDLVLPKVAISGLSGISLLLQALEQILAIDFSWQPTANGSVSQVSFINWWISWIPTIADVISQLVNQVATRLAGDGSAILDTIVGGVALISSCVLVGFQFNDPDKHDSFLESALIIGKLAGAAKFLRIERFVAYTEGASLVALALLDILSNAYTAVADLYSYDPKKL